MCMSISVTWLLVHQASTMHIEARIWCQIPQNWSYKLLLAAKRVMKTKLRSSVVLTAEPSLKPQMFFFNVYVCH